MSVFGTNYADGYDTLYGAKDYRAECDLVERLILQDSHSVQQRLLDIGCGTGGHSVELAKRHHLVTGVDRSPDMLARAQLKIDGSESLAKSVRFIQGDARHFQAPDCGTFDAAIMMFAVLGYLTTNDDLCAALGNIRRHLRLGGKFFCDFWWGPSVLHQRPGDRIRIVPTPSGRILRTTHSTLDTYNNTIDVQFHLIVLEGGLLLRESVETHRMRYFFGPELELLFKLNGFRIDRIGQFPDFDRTPTDDCWDAATIATAC